MGGEERESGGERRMGGEEEGREERRGWEGKREEDCIEKEKVQARIGHDRTREARQNEARRGGEVEGSIGGVKGKGQERRGQRRERREEKSTIFSQANKRKGGNHVPLNLLIGVRELHPLKTSFDIKGSS